MPSSFARDKQDQRIEVSFSGLLNALDGVAAQEGRIDSADHQSPRFARRGHDPARPD